METEKHRQGIEVPRENEGQRLDNFLFACLRGVPKSMIYRALRKGEIRLSSSRAKPSSRIAFKDWIRLSPFLYQDYQSIQQNKELSLLHKPKNLDKKLEAILSACVFEDEDFFVFNKPSGLAVQGGIRLAFGLIEMLRLGGFEKAELVHRLDQGTSGLLLVAKKRESALFLMEAFRERKVEKIYAAIGSGEVSWKTKEVLLPLIKDETLKESRIAQKGEMNAKASKTIFQKASSGELLEGAYTCLWAKPTTGRRHQIRLHARALSLPLLGDTRYGDFSLNEEASLRFLHLHAAFLSFPHPKTKQPVQFSLEVPKRWSLWVGDRNPPSF